MIVGAAYCLGGRAFKKSFRWLVDLIFKSILLLSSL